MKNKMVTLTLKMALFLLIANFIMLFIVKFNSAEWYITVISFVLMAILITVLRVIYLIKERKIKGGKTCDNDIKKQ